MKKLFVTDLDGTFLRGDHTFDRERLKKVLAQFREKGYLFVAASGRSLISVQSVFEGFEQEMAFIAENGSIVCYQDEVVFEDGPISPEIYLPLIKEIQMGPYGANGQILLSGKEGAYLLDNVDPIYRERITEYYHHIQTVSDFSEVDKEIVKLVATFPEGELDTANDWINATFEAVTSVTTGLDSVDIIASGIHKAVGISHLCTFFGLEAQDVVAFGDNQNDLEMLEFAGHSLATSNAHPEAKERADALIGHCNDDAVLEYIEEYLIKEQS